MSNQPSASQSTGSRFSSRFQPIAERCDGAGPHSGNEVRVLPLGSGSSYILCKACHWRLRSDIRWSNMRVYEVLP